MTGEPLADLLSMLGIALVGFLIWAALAPFEALGWWAGWFGDEIYSADEPIETPPATGRSQDPEYYFVFLSGISRVSGKTFSRREQNFLTLLSEKMPNAAVIDDIFPYSVNNVPLTGQPFVASLWRWALRRKLSDFWLERLAGYLINVRNLWQVAISIDKRYGPIYNQAMAQVIRHGLRRYGYEPAKQKPVILIGYSGAGQIAIGASAYLKGYVSAPVFVVSLGGIYGNDPGLMMADHVFHLYGSGDRAQHLGRLVFPGRWPIFFYSDYNRAVRMGRISQVCVGPMSHSGGSGYLTRSRVLENGLNHLERTVDVISSLPYQSHILTRLPGHSTAPTG